MLDHRGTNLFDAMMTGSTTVFVPLGCGPPACPLASRLLRGLLRCSGGISALPVGQLVGTRGRSGFVRERLILPSRGRLVPAGAIRLGACGWCTLMSTPPINSILLASIHKFCAHLFCCAMFLFT